MRAAAIFEPIMASLEELRPRTPRELKAANVRVRQSKEIACIESWVWNEVEDVFEVLQDDPLLDHPYVANRHFTSPPTTYIKVSDGLGWLVGEAGCESEYGMEGQGDLEAKVSNPWGVTSGEAYYATAAL